MDLTEFEKLYQLNTMVLKDCVPSGLRAPVYLFTEIQDNQESVLRRGASLHRVKKASRLLLIDNLGGSEPGYPGALPWLTRLYQLGVPDEMITLIPFTEPLLHTLSEAMAMVRFAQERGWKEIIISFPTFHGARCFLSAITAVRHFNSTLRVYCQVGISQAWHQPALHSQKAVYGLRKDLVVHELRRIRRYQRKSKFLRLISEGSLFLKQVAQSESPMAELQKIPLYLKQGSPVPLVSTDEALRYLEWRDRA